MSASPARGVKPRQYRDLMEKAITQGWTFSMTGQNHVRLDPPDRSGPVFASLTSSDRRSWLYLRTMLRKRGVIC